MVNDGPHRRRTAATSERGQAYTLEGFVGAFIVLTALLFAIQSVVLTPTTAGTVDQKVKSQLQVQAHDTLAIAGDRGELKDLTLYWNNTSDAFAHSYGKADGYGRNPPCVSNDKPLCEQFGRQLNDTFTSHGFVYNLYLDFQTKGTGGKYLTNTTTVVYQGVPSSNAVTTTYTIVIYDDMTLTSPAPANAGGRPIGVLSDNEFYAPDVEKPGPVYDVVEVRLVVW